MCCRHLSASLQYLSMMKPCQRRSVSSVWVRLSFQFNLFTNWNVSIKESNYSCTQVSPCYKVQADDNFRIRNIYYPMWKDGQPTLTDWVIETCSLLSMWLLRICHSRPPSKYQDNPDTCLHTNVATCTGLGECRGIIATDIQAGFRVSWRTQIDSFIYFLWLWWRHGLVD